MRRGTARSDQTVPTKISGIRSSEEEFIDGIGTAHDRYHTTCSTHLTLAKPKSATLANVDPFPSVWIVIV